MASNKKFILLIAGILLIKIFLSLVVPLTGDEAYFIITGKYHLALGYYEHPPMIWWLAYLFSGFGRYTPAVFIYRLFPVFSTIIIGIIIFFFLKEYDREKAFLISSVFLLSPLNILAVVFVNDIPLVLFTFLSGIFFFYGMKREKTIYFILSGIFFGLAFLCKYFAVLYFLALLVFCMFNRKNWKNFWIFVLSSFPLIFINAYWNYTHDWINLLFNLIYRNRHFIFKPKHVLMFFIYQIYLITPWVLYYIIKKGKKFFDFKEKRVLFFIFLYVIPIAFLFYISFKTGVGIHWTISFLPFLFLCIITLETYQLKNSFKYNVFFAGFQILLIATICLLPITSLKKILKNLNESSGYSDVVMFKSPGEICKEIQKFPSKYILAAHGYTEASIMSYYDRRYFVIFGSLSRSGREDDVISDFTEFNGKDFLIFCPEKPDKKFYGQFFKKVKIVTRKIDGATVYFVLGKKFIFRSYKNLILKKVLEDYYTVPKFLPHYGNPFKEKYHL
ncbi:MAG: glycosyltransferase family 39 protein [Candidatus Omnitrophica bacterium]|nr:glycosyltransferase family 39 protein [Candidatus Omnitrophota bacterium]